MIHRKESAYRLGSIKEAISVIYEGLLEEWLNCFSLYRRHITLLEQWMLWTTYSSDK